MTDRDRRRSAEQGSAENVAGTAGELVPINEVARELGIRASTIRYYEERELVSPTRWRSGKRWYDRAAIRRLAVVRFWAESGLMSLDRVAALLASPAWASSTRNQIDELNDRIERMTQARDLLLHILEHHPDTAPDGCRHYESAIWDRALTPGPPTRHPAA